LAGRGAKNKRDHEKGGNQRAAHKKLQREERFPQDVSRPGLVS